MIQKGITVKGAKALILGITFKENCPDIRNTRVVDIYAELQAFGLDVAIYDPWADAAEVKAEYGIDLTALFDTEYDAVILATAHDSFKKINLTNISKQVHVLFDTKAVFEKKVVDGRM